MENVIEELLKARPIMCGRVAAYPSKGEDAMRRPRDYIIEIEEEPLGLAVSEAEHVVFHAIHPAVQELHGRAYFDAVEARSAALKAFRSAA